MFMWWSKVWLPDWSDLQLSTSIYLYDRVNNLCMYNKVLLFQVTFTSHKPGVFTCGTNPDISTKQARSQLFVLCKRHLSKRHSYELNVCKTAYQLIVAFPSGSSRHLRFGSIEFLYFLLLPTSFPRMFTYKLGIQYF